LLKNIAQNVAQSILTKILHNLLTVEKGSPKIWAASATLKKPTQSKQSPIGRKFAHSGHSGIINSPP
jgi:hypothetical protein